MTQHESSLELASGILMLVRGYLRNDLADHPKARAIVDKEMDDRIKHIETMIRAENSS